MRSTATAEPRSPTAVGFRNWSAALFIGFHNFKHRRHPARVNVLVDGGQRNGKPLGHRNPGATEIHSNPIPSLNTLETAACQKPGARLGIGQRRDGKKVFPVKPKWDRKSPSTPVG